jgi:hypothetical protein
MSPKMYGLMVSDVKPTLYGGNPTIDKTHVEWIGFLWIASAESYNSCRQAVLGVK